MTFLTWTIRLVILVFLVVFAAQNTDLVTVRLFAGYQWQAPMVVILLLSVVLGGVLGVLALVGTLYRQHRLIRRLTKDRDAPVVSPSVQPPAP